MNRKNLAIWETVGYITLALCVFGQIAVGKWYILAQTAYLISNALGVLRDYKMDLPKANKVRDWVFTGITLALIVVRVF